MQACMLQSSGRAYEPHALVPGRSANCDTAATPALATRLVTGLHVLLLQQAHEHQHGVGLWVEAACHLQAGRLRREGAEGGGRQLRVS